MNEVYDRLRRTGEIAVARDDVTRLRRWAKRDGFTLVQATTRDYMGRKTVTVALTDGHGMIVTVGAGV